VADGLDERRKVDGHTLRIDVPAWAHREIDAVESERLDRPAEIAGVHARQMLRKETKTAAETRAVLCAHR
jgi:hypothetical protein